ncbi:MAG: bifunctional (p)ppGpp synthetase/guanosine-3',5'-bis(diphosphate) 3'-pyrophosphohydrolase [Lachnospiraceae bacterium]|jgi:GTP pyrophosphokinase|nr:bifunctional (p)ppGpp synthetase/guanosine-3',5'-bis(diphosphate) 3'-pyrophosphohydrolase [Lachnospiraceae bacterium]
MEDEGNISREVVIDDGRIGEITESQSPETLYQGLLSRILKYHPSSNLSLIEKAYKFANEAHRDQFRKSGEPYIIHPLYVANILADMESDKESIAAGLLHDVVEDTELTAEDIRKEFGDEVAVIVEGLTNLSNIMLPPGQTYDKKTDRMEMQAENLRKMFLAMANDIRVILIKLVDRLHNMRTLEHQSPESQLRTARETLEIYAPIAERLGISKIKVELDDLALKYLEPEAYHDLVDKIKDRRSVREQHIQTVVAEISAHINEANIKAIIDGRVKHFLSIYKKMVTQGKSIDQLYDLFAVRIVVDTVSDCYTTLGVIHDLYRPMPGRFKDYIAMPKLNAYRALHTTLIGVGGQPLEVQIRTHEMHKEAEYGITAHWKYKVTTEGKHTDAAEEEKLQWLRQILEWQQEMSDNKDFMSSLRSDLDIFSDTVYCFTPAGDVKNLPAGSTPIDFAYSVHSEVGNKMIGARVDGKIVTNDYLIQTGDRIEIMTSKNSKGPSRDWLNIVKTTQAKNKIQQWFRSEYKVENIIKGKDLITQYCKVRGVSLTELMKPEFTDIIIKKYGFRDWDSVLAAVGHGGMSEGQIINKLIDAGTKAVIETDEETARKINESTISHKTEQIRGHSEVIVKGADDIAVRFAKCCSPLPGDEIIGFVTRGRGVSIHRTDCANVWNVPEPERERMIEASWQRSNEEVSGDSYLAEVKIYADNRSGLLADITRLMAEKKINIASVNTRVNKQNMGIIDMAFEVKSREEMTAVITMAKKIDNVIDIERI